MQEKKEHEIVRGYIRLSKTWHAAGSPLQEPIITIGNYISNIPCATGEMSIIWRTLNGAKLRCPQVSDECWNRLSKFSDLTTEMAKASNKHLSEEKFAALLIRLGYADVTEYEKPLTTRRQPRTIRGSPDSGLQI